MQDWVRNDLIGDWAVPRHLIRSMVPFIPVFAAFMLFPRTVGPAGIDGAARSASGTVLFGLLHGSEQVAPPRASRFAFRPREPEEDLAPRRREGRLREVARRPPRRRHLGHKPWRALPPFNSQTRCSTVAEKPPPSGSVERRADSTSCSTRYPLIAIAAVEPAAAALITWVRGSTTLPAPPQIPGTPVAPERSTATNPVGAGFAAESRQMCVVRNETRRNEQC